MALSALALDLCACGGASSSSSPTPTAVGTPTPTATPAPSSTSTPELSALELKVQTAHIAIDVAGMTPMACGDMSVLSHLPATSEVDFVDCSPNYIEIIGNKAGPLGALSTAPVGTPIEWSNAGGAMFHTATAMDPNTQDRDPSTGEYPGHGVPSPIADILVRTSTQQTEVYGPLTMG
ncbi:MAG: hypothetical protein JOY80_00550 [Candidatus Dormibacteraeota bacterium]|nr:hypothetical protein [Candidatus Dormibacteraeota bacterium]